MEPDFSGWATKSNIKCTDGRTIMPGAFKHQDQQVVPLVWQHNHSNPDNVLGHAMLEDRAFGTYVYGFFNGTPNGQHQKEAVKHKDVVALSIYANNLSEQQKHVMHGDIKEVSLVLAGANPEATIDFINFAHGDDIIVSDDEAIIYTGLQLENETVGHSDEPELDPENNEPGESTMGDELKHAAGTATAEPETQTVQDVFNTMTPEQQEAAFFVIGEAVKKANAEAAGSGGTAAHSELGGEPLDTEAILAHMDTTINDKITEGFSTMEHNIFEAAQAKNKKDDDRPVLNHSQLERILEDGPKYGSLKQSFLEHAEEYGINDIDLLFPDATMDGNGITYVSRRMEWVQSVLSGTKHTPFSRIKSISADLTADEARAKGYVKGNLKKDEVITMLRRITTPTTVYKKQKLDRDDIVDITEVDILVWIQAEMRVMLDEEIAGAILIGDGRDVENPDKIDETHVRPIAYDIDMYNTSVNLAADITPDEFVDQVVLGLNNFKGSGVPIMYTTRNWLTQMLLTKDTLNRRFYATKTELAAALGVSDIVDVEILDRDSDLVAIVVNLQDYTIGADKGGEINLFDFFDIDYNQQKYLLETRISGALTRPKAAVSFFLNSGRIVTPTVPTFVTSTGVLTVPTLTGVVYIDADTNTTLSAGAQTAIAAGAIINIEAIPAAGYGFTHDADVAWTFQRDA